MGLAERAKSICLTPKTEWPVISGESTTAGSLISGYIAPLALIVTHLMYCTDDLSCWYELHSVLPIPL
jgi:hypothetical protein